MQAVAEQMHENTFTGLGLAFVTHLSGDALIMSTDDRDWAALSPNLSLRIGDRIWVQDGARVEVRFPLGATAWVSYRSELDIARMERGSRVDTIQLALVSGEATFDVKNFARPGSVFQVDAPGVSVRAHDAARFRINCLPDGTAQIGVIGGSVVLETPDGFTDVTGGQMAEVQPDRRVFMDFLPPTDGWDAWVQSRAAIYDRPAVSVRHLPPDLRPYAHEFDTSGRWVNDRTYGYVWVPAVERGWSPYSNGRWVWQANDYVWLSHDPWYAPFHYGRWGWSVSIGWFWIVPRGAIYWSPGYVAWSVFGDEVCWVPLGHNEVYYGYGNYGPGSVNVHRTTVVNVTNVYINSRVTNGVVVVRKDNFLRGRIREVRIAPARNPFERRGGGEPQIIARPPVQEVRPIRETRQPRPEVSTRRFSPPTVRIEKESKAIKERVVAPTKEKSAFKKAGPPPPLRNIQKEKELERWVPPRKAPASKPAPATTTAPAERPKKGDAPGKPAPSAVQAREERMPTGKRHFKRVPEPQGGGSAVPVRPVMPEEPVKGMKERQR
jgi:hypothetical protein